MLCSPTAHGPAMSWSSSAALGACPGSQAGNFQGALVVHSDHHNPIAFGRQEQDFIALTNTHMGMDTAFPGCPRG